MGVYYHVSCSHLCHFFVQSPKPAVFLNSEQAHFRAKAFLLMVYMRFSQLNFMDISTDDNNCTLEIVYDSTSPDSQIQTLTQPVTRTCLQRL